jgi:hypothetical protein
LLSILQAQKTSFYVAFLICVILLSLQSPLLNSVASIYNRRIPGLRSFSFMSAAYSVKALGNGGFLDFLISFFVIDDYNFPSFDDAGFMKVSFGYFVLETVHLVILGLWCAFSALFAVHKFYKLGSDPMSVKSPQESEVAVKSTGQVTSASQTSRDAHSSVSYVSPSRAILDSIKRFSASSIHSRDSNPAQSACFL